jgi:hypothetical protein
MQTEIEPTWGSSQADLEAWSPASYCPLHGTPILMGASTGDEIVPQRQMQDLIDAGCSQAKAVRLDGNVGNGPVVGFPHAGITPAAAAKWQADMFAFLPAWSQSQQSIAAIRAGSPAARTAVGRLRARTLGANRS